VKTYVASLGTASPVYSRRLWLSKIWYETKTQGSSGRHVMGNLFASMCDKQPCGTSIPFEQTAWQVKRLLFAERVLVMPMRRRAISMLCCSPPVSVAPPVGCHTGTCRQDRIQTDGVFGNWEPQWPFLLCFSEETAGGAHTHLKSNDKWRLLQKHVHVFCSGKDAGMQPFANPMQQMRTCSKVVQQSQAAFVAGHTPELKPAKPSQTSHLLVKGTHALYFPPSLMLKL
jgi:hypothetical protein